MLALLLVAACAAVVWLRARPISPIGPATELGTAAVLTVPAPDGTPAVPSDGAAPETPVGLGCFDRLARSAGWMDLCWQLARVPDLGPAADHYRLSVYGSLSGRAWPADVRHVLVRITPTADCAPTVIVDASPTARAPEGQGPAGGTSTASGWGGVVLGDGAYAAVWNAPDLLVGATGTRAIELYVVERVPVGSCPAWTIDADLSW